MTDVSLGAIVSYVAAPVIGLLTFFTRRTLNELERRVKEVEEKTSQILTEDKVRQVIDDKLAPLKVGQDVNHRDLEEIKRKLDKIISRHSR